jgi:hypothetical protein
VVTDHAVSKLLPAAIDRRGFIELLESPPPPFAEGFIAETLAAIVAADQSAVRTRIRSSTLLSFQPDRPPPTGVIAHVGRCGSTLLCRMLDATGAVATFREPEVLIDAALLDDEIVGDAIAAIVGQYAWMANAAARTAVVKLPSHVHMLLDRLAPPARAARVFVIRHPVPVVASLINSPPHWLLRVLAEHGQQGDEDRRTVNPTAAAIEILADHWNGFVDSMANLGSAPYGVTLTYGELVSNPARTVNRVAGVVGFADDDTDSAISSVLGRDAKSGRVRLQPQLTPPLPPDAVSHLLHLTRGHRRVVADLTGRPDEFDSGADKTAPLAAE